MILAADYPFLDIFWSMLIFFTWVVWIWMMVVILTDVFRRRDIGGWSKAAWTFFLIVLPFIGAFTYLIVNHDGMPQRQAQDLQDRQSALDARIKTVAGNPNGGNGAVADIAHAKELLDAGTIDESEFQQLKQKALA
jgi:hypothetical protein